MNDDANAWAVAVPDEFVRELEESLSPLRTT
jgi:hypothetical protein